MVSGGGLDVAAVVAAGAGPGVGPGAGRRGSLLVSGCAALRDPRAGKLIVCYIFVVSVK